MGRILEVTLLFFLTDQRLASHGRFRNRSGYLPESIRFDSAKFGLIRVNRVLLRHPFLDYHNCLTVIVPPNAVNGTASAAICVAYVPKCVVTPPKKREKCPRFSTSRADTEPRCVISFRCSSSDGAVLIKNGDRKESQSRIAPTSDWSG